MRGISINACLRSGQTHRITTERVQRHGHECHRDLFASSHQHVHLTRAGRSRDLLSKTDQLVCGMAHGTDHHHNAVAGVACFNNACSTTHDPLRIGDAGSAKFLDDRWHPACTHSLGARCSMPRAVAHTGRSIDAHHRLTRTRCAAIRAFEVTPDLGFAVGAEFNRTCLQTDVASVHTVLAGLPDQSRHVASTRIGYRRAPPLQQSLARRANRNPVGIAHETGKLIACTHGSQSLPLR